MIKWGRFSVALVWLYEGLWNKILANSRQQEAIFASAPCISGHLEAPQTVIGSAEVVLGLWILSAYRAGAAALVQILLLTSMNLAGLVFARDSIGDPPGMLIHNTAFLTLAWIVSRPDTRREHAS